MSTHFDVIIVGSGAGGGTLAQRVEASTGKSILILERGEHIPREVENWDSKAVFIDKRYRTKEQWYDSRGKPFVPNTHYWVGGNTTFYGAALMRLRNGDFDEVKHAGGISPAWPVSLADMAPYYAEAETLWRVHGARGVDPTENGDEPPYAFPAIHHDPGIERLKSHFEQQGWRPFHLPAAASIWTRRILSSSAVHPLQDLGWRLSLPGEGQMRCAHPRRRAPALNEPNVTLLTRPAKVFVWRRTVQAEGHRGGLRDGRWGRALDRR